MNTKKIEAMFDGIENKKEIMELINSENGKDVEKYKSRAENFEAELTSLKLVLEQNNTDLQKLELLLEENNTLKTQLDSLNSENALKERETQLSMRFSEVISDREFKHPLIKDAVFAEFCEVLENSENLEKTDLELFSLITEGKDYFASQNPAVFTGNINTESNIANSTILRSAMGLPQENY